MIEPVAMKDFFITFFSSALIIMAGLSYALLFAWSKVKSNRWLKIFSYLSFLVLVYAVLELTVAANFSGHWLILTWVMVAGYFFAPIAVWRLSISTHNHPIVETNNRRDDE